MAWTDKMVEDLKIMWEQGLTTGEIGKRLGVSKNSIVGKVHRLQLTPRPSPIKKKADGEPKAKKTSKKEGIIELVVEPEKKEELIIELVVEPSKTTKKETAKSSSKKEKEAKNKEKAEATFKKEPANPYVYRQNMSLAELDNRSCRWPIGDPKDEDFHFCGKKVKPGFSYCEAHCAVAYVKPNKK